MRSDAMKKGYLRAPHRSLLKALGLTDEELERPIIGIASSANEIIPGHIHLKEIAGAVKAGIRLAGGVPLEFSTIGICDGIAMDHNGMRYSLPSREIVCDSVELTARATPFDGLVCVPNCDKITPGMMMAMGKLNLPSILVSGGPMLAGKSKGEKVDLISVFEGVGKYKKEEINEEELLDLENNACPGAGSCSGLFTANSMNILCEALGMALEGNGTVPAVSAERIRLAKRTGFQIVRLVKNNMKIRDIVKEDSFHNAVAVDLALGGSSNTVLHLPAVAHSFGIDFDIDLFDRLSRKIPHLGHFSPVGDKHIEDLHQAGGISALLNRLKEKGLIENNAGSVAEKTMGDVVDGKKVFDNEVIRPLDNPYHQEGGIGILKGSLAPEGAVCKTAGVPEKMMYHKGTAVVFEDGELATKEILAGKVKAGDVVVIRYEGPKGGPGMREMLSPTSAIVGMGLLEKVALITDGRFSGGSTGTVIGHVSPEAAEGGPIKYVQDGDEIEVDIAKRKLNLLIDESEMRKREKEMKTKETDLESDVLRRYSRQVTSANTGAVFK